jgi:hypothetical protein
MSKLANMFSLLNLEGEDDGEDDREVTQTSSTSIGDASKPGWYSFSPRLYLQSSGLHQMDFPSFFRMDNLLHNP